MEFFGIRFFLCNIFICAIIGIFLITKRALRNFLTDRMQFNLWFLLIGLLAVPFIPLRPIGFSQILAWFGTWKNTVSSHLETTTETTVTVNLSGTVKQMNDFALSVSNETPSIVGLFLCGIWLIGIIVMLLFIARSVSRLNTLKKSALPLQNKNVRMIYNNCLREMKIKRNIPVYSTAYLKSPVIAGLFRPCIYLPIHLVSDFNAADIRYILLHELQHYRHKDALAVFFMNLASVLYWFNPLVWFALKEMRNDREISCDISVLKILEESEYINYGNTLINLAEKISFTPFPFAAGISGSMKQIQRRIIHISSYQKLSNRKKLRGLITFAVIAVLLFGLTPMLSTCAAEQNQYKWNISPEKVSTMDLSSYFKGYKGSFVLYDLKVDSWNIYDMDQATLRTSPNSTYKIYDALFGLEEGIISPADSFMSWNGTDYTFETWNMDQDLSSAMLSSVNWYFQEIDEQLGLPVIQNYIRKIGYGNESISSNLSSYWMQSTLNISPIEQVELLTDLYHNRFGFTPENVNIVKDSICLYSSENKNLYGKTGTGRVDGQDVNGWFIGYIEINDDTYFFATNIQKDSEATGSKAAEITKTVLSDLNLWQP